MGLIHGQLLPQYIKEDKNLPVKEYLYSDPNDINKGWTVVDGSSPRLDLNLQSQYLITGISFRSCTEEQSCPLPTVFRVVMWNNSDSWIYFKYTTNDGVDSVGGCVFIIFCSSVEFCWWTGRAIVNGTVLEL